MTIYYLYIYYNFYKFIYYLHRYYLILKYTMRSNHIVTLSTLLLTNCFYRFYNQVKEEIRMILRESPGLMNSQNKCAFCVRKIAFPVCLNKKNSDFHHCRCGESFVVIVRAKPQSHGRTGRRPRSSQSFACCCKRRTTGSPSACRSPRSPYSD